MNKKEALQALLDGNKVRLKSWLDNNGRYLNFEDGFFREIYGELSHNCNLNDFKNLEEWEIYKESKNKKKIVFYEYVYHDLLNKSGTTLLWTSCSPKNPDHKDYKYTGNTKEVEIEINE